MPVKVFTQSFMPSSTELPRNGSVPVPPYTLRWPRTLCSEELSMAPRRTTGRAWGESSDPGSWRSPQASVEPVLLKLLKLPVHVLLGGHGFLDLLGSIRHVCLERLRRGLAWPRVSFSEVQPRKSGEKTGGGKMKNFTKISYPRNFLGGISAV